MTRRSQMTRDAFENWLMYLDDAIEQLFVRLPTDVQQKLDFSPESLDVIEAWILANYPDVQSILADEHMQILDGLARYVGETYRTALGGIWSIILDKPEDAYAGLPIITGIQSKIGAIVSPITLIVSSTDRRSGRFLRSILNNYLAATKPRGE